MTTRTCALIVSVLLLGASVADAQTARTGRLMREKLLHSQRILAALTTSDYVLLQKETLALTQVTQSPTWAELMTTELRPYTGGFTKALADLTAAADRRDLDAATASYSALTTACFSCHKHVMRSRIARAP
jgi:cytochrome c553